MDFVQSGYRGSLIADIRSGWCFARLRRQSLQWGMDPALVAQAAELCPALWDYADATHAVMYADADLRIVLDRIWHGYPDAPQFALAVFRGGRMRVLWNFQHWPQRWTITR